MRRQKETDRQYPWSERQLGCAVRRQKETDRQYSWSERQLGGAVRRQKETDSTLGVRGNLEAQ